MKFFSKSILAVLFLAAALVGCASPEQTGRPINFAKLERLSVGLSTQQTVKEVFGYPQAIEYPDNRTIYRYRYAYKSNSQVYKEGVDFVFNKQQRLIDITVNDAEEYQPLQ
ncbi:putative Lipoprotein [Vibrio nigripulchritudo SOn1]|uniref:Lipoprotein n=1 Tax=Vibrio nigripulchritudo SOn1 TaxID=1238450 RepID=A0AAV2VQ64_9VIBR|nr:lipoprotein [Vibrio nigripulchritudo]CCO46821.1 putative Lipoprotein [Vibrio nigripulchritudo SOn1]